MINSFGYLQEKCKGRVTAFDLSYRFYAKVRLVLDRDTWKKEVLNTIGHRCLDLRFNLAVSNSCFEYWLLLHFGRGVESQVRIPAVKK